MLDLGRTATLQRAAASVTVTNDGFGSPSSEAGQLGKVRNATRHLLRYRQRTAAGAHPPEHVIGDELRVHQNCGPCRQSGVRRNLWVEQLHCSAQQLLWP